MSDNVKVSKVLPERETVFLAKTWINQSIGKQCDYQSISFDRTVAEVRISLTDGKRITKRITLTATKDTDGNFVGIPQRLEQWPNKQRPDKNDAHLSLSLSIPKVTAAQS